MASRERMAVRSEYEQPVEVFVPVWLTQKKYKLIISRHENRNSKTLKSHIKNAKE